MSDLITLVRTSEFHKAMSAVLFDAVRAGYATNCEKGTVPTLPEYKLVPTYTRGPWRVTDMYTVSPELGTMSGGMMNISYEGKPVWMMHYFGEYDDEVIPCLKAALMANNGQTDGCRGPLEFTYGDFLYTLTRHVGTGLLSNGREEIHELKSGKCRGWHEYYGFMMW